MLSDIQPLIQYHIAVKIIFIISIKLTDCDVITETPNGIITGYQRDTYSIKDVLEPESLPVLTGNDTRCRISEYQCTNKKCVPINRFCDGSNDCGDSSDEPRHCTRCNKTYYGDIGRTYELELHRPREDLVPYVCLLTITAPGGVHGDLVQDVAGDGYVWDDIIIKPQVDSFVNNMIASS